MSSLTDSELLRRYLAEGSESAFAALVERHLPLVYGAAFRQLNDAARAREVAQNAFVALARRGVWLAGHPSLGGWLYHTTLNLARHESRAEQRRRQRERIALELGTCMKLDDSPLDAIAPVLDEAMLELRAPDREALLLRFFANKSMREVGAALGIQEDAAQKRVAKALEALTEKFRRRGFRVSGATAAALVLQQAAASAIPEGLAIAATKAAVTAGAAASLGSLTMPVFKFMSLTKIQTAALCVVVAVVPFGYQWNTLNHARDEATRLSGELGGLRETAGAREKDQSRAERRLAVLEDERLQRVARQHAPARTVPARNLYVWDENSPFVRVPKEALKQLHFAPFATRIARDGKAEQYQLPPLLADGTPQPALAAALGLSAAESQQLAELTRKTFSTYNELSATHSQLTDAPLGPNQGVKLATAAFPDEGGQLRDQFQQQLAALLGPERADTFWQQSTPMFNEVLNNFGANNRDLQLIYNSNQTLELFNMAPSGSSVGQLDQRNGMPLPAQLQPYVDAWGAQITAARAAAQNQPAK